MSYNKVPVQHWVIYLTENSVYQLNITHYFYNDVAPIGGTKTILGGLD